MNFHKLAYFLLRIYCKFFVFSPYTCVVGIIRKNGKLLLVEHSDGNGFVFPGGIVKYGESMEQGLKREVFEETGFKVKVGKQLGAVSFTPSSLGVNNTVVVYNCEIVSGSLKESSEGKPGFFSLKKLPGLSPDALVMFKKFL